MHTIVIDGIRIMVIVAVTYTVGALLDLFGISIKKSKLYTLPRGLLAVPALTIVGITTFLISRIQRLEFVSDPTLNLKYVETVIVLNLTISVVQFLSWRENSFVQKWWVYVFWPLDWMFWRINMFIRTLAQTDKTMSLAIWSAIQLILIVFTIFICVLTGVHLTKDGYVITWLTGILVRRFGSGNRSKILSVLHQPLSSIMLGLLIASLPSM